MIVAPNSVDVSTYFKLVHPTTGVPVTGATITDLDITYVRDRAAAVKADLTALAAVDSVHGDNKAIQIDATNAPGLYRVDFPDAAFAAGVSRVQLVVNGAAIDPAVLEVELAPWLTLITGATVKADLETWLTVAPLALSSQQVQAVVPTTQKVDVETIKTKGVTVDAGGTTFPASVGTSTYAGGAVASVSGAVGSIASGGISSGSFAAGAIDAAAIAAGAIDNATFAADVGSTAYATNIIALAADKAIVNAALATATELGKVPKSDSTVSWNATALAAINAEVDAALNTAIPGSPTADSINERVKAMDDLTQASGGGDLAAIKGYVDDIGVAGAGLTAIPTIAAVTTVATTTNLTNLPAAAALEATLTAMKGATFSGTTDSLEAISDMIAAQDLVGLTEVIDGVWDEALSGHVTAGTSGKKLTDLANADLSGLATTIELAKVPKSDGAVTWNNTALASINAQADLALADYDPPTNTEMEARTLAAASIAKSTALLNATPSGAVVDDNNPDPTTLLFETNLTEATDDHYNGAFVVFTSGALLGQSRKISDYDGTSKVVTVATAFTEAPAAADAFIILGRSE